MKKLTLCLALIIALLVPGAVLATESLQPEVGVATQAVVDMNGNTYTSIAEAIEAIEDKTVTTTITLLDNVEEGAGFVVPEDSNIVIDFNGKTYNVTAPLVGSTGTQTLGCQLLKNSTIELKNGTFTSNTAKMLVQNYSNLTLTDMVLDATASEENSYVLSNNQGKTKITGNTSIKGNKVAFDVCWAPNKGYPNGTQVTVDTAGMIVGDIEIGTWGKINDSDKENVLSTLTINNINHNGEISILADYLTGQITIDGGVFSTDVSEYVADEYFCPYINDEYIVKSSEKHTITVIEAVGGKVSVDKSSAQYGEIVNVTVQVNDGYQLVSLDCGDEGMGGDIVGQESFVMLFDGNVTITPVFEKLPVEDEETSQEVVLPEDVQVADSEKVEEMLVETLAELAETNPELAKALENENIKIEVEFNDKVELAGDEQECIEAAVEKEVAGLKISKYMDITISVYEKESGNYLDSLEELKEAITFTIPVPEELPEVKEGYTRKYYIIRNHNGDIDVWEVNEKDGKLSFDSDKFSTYAIAYKDVEVKEETKDDKENPATGDNIVLYVVTLVVAVVGIASAVIIKKRNSSKK